MKIVLFKEKDDIKSWKNKLIIASKNQLSSIFDSKKDKEIVESLKFINSNKIEQSGNAYIITFNLLFLDPLSKQTKFERIGLYTDFQNFSLYITENKNNLQSILSNFVDSKIDHTGVLLKLIENITENDFLKLETLENELISLDNKLLKEVNLENSIKTITYYKKLLIRYKHYYELLIHILDFFVTHNSYLSDQEELTEFVILQRRIPKLYNEVIFLRESISQIQDTYQSQVGIKQNRLMKIFTILTAIFLPLQVIVGWYGMNFKMPEYTSKISYPIMAGISLVLVVIAIIIFKKKNWFK